MIEGNQNLTAQARTQLWEGGQTKATTCNIAENEGNVLSHNICCSNIFDREQTSCNMIQQHTTRWSNGTNFFFTTNVVHCCMKSWDRLTGALDFSITLISSKSINLVERKMTFTT